MKYTNIKLTETEILKTLAIVERAKQEFEEAKESGDYTVYLIAKDWLEDINVIIEKLEKALDEFYKAPF